MSSSNSSSTTTLVADQAITKNDTSKKIVADDKDQKIDEPTTPKAKAGDLASDTGFSKAAKDQGWASSTMYRPSLGQ